jgi:flagellar protein FliJ
MARHWLSGLLRARQAQEDAAAQQLAAAERAARRAAARVRYDRDRLDSLRTADALYDAPVFVAAAVALQAAAATHAAAVQVAEHSARVVEERRDDLIDAARARRSAEELHERQLHEASAKARRIAQGELDEVAARVRRDAAAGEHA